MPGAACDVPAALYSFSFAPSGGWTRVLPERDELWAYIKKVADEYDLPKRITLGTKVERCTWDEQRKVWRMRVRHVETGQFLTHECQFLFAGTGQLAEPRKPDLPGIDNFKGPVFSATWWRDDVDLTDKRVVVFGNGCTGCQIVPAIADRCKQVTHVVRSKHWIAPPTDSPVIEQTRFLLNTVPGLLSLLRLLVFTIAESAFPAFQMDKAGTRNRQRRQAKVERYMRKAAPAEYHDLLIPDFQFGCKRRIFDPGYLPSLHRPNVTLTGAAVEELTPGGVRFENGEVVEADVVVLATGYATGQYFHGMDIIGREGSIQEHWKQFGGPEAYNCSAVNGFPNFTMILGPNSATGHTSAVMAIENTINFGLRAIKPVLDGAAETVEVSREAEERYSQKMQAVLRGMVWETGCGSWYVKKNADGTEWNSHTYPWGQARLWYDSVFLRKKDFVYTVRAALTRSVRTC